MMNLETLPDELLLYLFEFLDDVRLFRAFYGLNYRFNSLFFSLGRIYHLDFRSVSKDDYANIFREYLPAVTDRISSIHFSNDDETPGLIEHLLHRSLPLRLLTNLRLLTFSHISSYETIKQVAEECRYVPDLTHLRFEQCLMKLTTRQFRSLVVDIWHLPKLTHCHIEINSPETTSFPTFDVISSSLKYLTIESSDIPAGILPKLTVNAPSLRYLAIRIGEQFQNRHLSCRFESLVSLKLFVCNAWFAVEKLLKCMPNLRRLTVELLDNSDRPHYSNVLTSGQKWRQMIVDYLPKLKTFQLKIKGHNQPREQTDKQIDDILQSFSSYFWIRKRQWFVRCEWNTQKTPYFCLFTLPYSFNHFDIPHPWANSKSTSPQENDYCCYDRVRELEYHCLFPSPLMRNRIRFPNLCYLSILLPATCFLNVALPTLQHLHSLCVSIPDHVTDVHGQLQILLDRAPHLYALKISCTKLKAAEMAVMKTSSLSVRRLDLHEYTEQKEWYWFNHQQCVALSRSALGMKCEMLRIHVENPMDVVELIYSMPHLRALNVRIVNDTYEVLAVDSAMREDGLIRYLKDFLDSTCTVTRDEWQPRQIHLWIR